MTGKTQVLHQSLGEGRKVIGELQNGQIHVEP